MLSQVEFDEVEYLKLNLKYAKFKNRKGYALESETIFFDTNEIKITIFLHEPRTGYHILFGENEFWFYLDEIGEIPAHEYIASLILSTRRYELTA